MSRKRQSVIFNPQGRPSAPLTTLSYDFLDGAEIPEHYHGEAQLVFASRGIMTIRTVRDLWVVPPARAVWIPCSEDHSITMSGAVSMRTLYFASRVAKAVQRLCVVLNVSPFFRELILHACTKPEWRMRVATDRRIVEVLLDQLKVAASIPLQLPHPRDPRAVRIVDLLLAAPSDPRTLDELCKGIGGSKRTIERAFLSGTAMTFGKWRQQLRLLHGMRLMAEGEKVTIAALESGYNSPSAFISVFKKAFGQTPAQYLGERLKP